MRVGSNVYIRVSTAKDLNLAAEDEYVISHQEIHASVILPFRTISSTVQ